MGRFYDRLQVKWDEGKFVCVGLDPDITKILPLDWMSEHNYLGDSDVFTHYLTSIVNATGDSVCAYKPNLAFFIGHGLPGMLVLESVVDYIHANYPDVVVILDAKVGDIGNTNSGYAHYAFHELEVDAITVHPYMGHRAMIPFLSEVDRGVIVLVRTSNEGADEFQGLQLSANLYTQGWYDLYHQVAESVRLSWNLNSNCAVVVGATAPGELIDVRGVIGDDIPILIPGVGAQGGDLTTAVQNGCNSRGDGFIINAGRSVLYPANPENDPFLAARMEVEHMNDVIHQALFVPPAGNDV